MSDSRDPVDCRLPGFSVHGIPQARILEWVAISSFRGSSRPRDWTCISCIDRQILTTEPPGKTRKGRWSFPKPLPPGGGDLGKVQPRFSHSPSFSLQFRPLSLLVQRLLSVVQTDKWCSANTSEWTKSYPLTLCSIWGISACTDSKIFMMWYLIETLPEGFFPSFRRDTGSLPVISAG